MCFRVSDFDGIRRSMEYDARWICVVANVDDSRCDGQGKVRLHKKTKESAEARHKTFLVDGIKLQQSLCLLCWGSSPSVAGQSQVCLEGEERAKEAQPLIRQQQADVHPEEVVVRWRVSRGQGDGDRILI